jgi:integrase|tara:strand:+ start:5534 stop:6514 length:981 start_codon:yes stop_codon:yes gene_type:complete
MPTLRKHYGSWQSIVRIQGHPTLTKSFKSRTDAKRWGVETELKLRREDAGIAKIKFPKFEDVARRYVEEVSIHKRSHRDERYTILGLFHEAWSSYPIHRIRPTTINNYMAKLSETVSGSTINRRLDVISSMFTTFKKEYGYPVDNPVLSIRRPKKAQPRDRRFTDEELDKLIKGNRTSPQLRSIMKIALETGLRMSEILRLDARLIEGSTIKIPVAKTRPRIIPLTTDALAEIRNADLPFTLTKYALDKQFRKLCKYYGIEDAHFHDLRHQALTNFMKDKGLNVPETMMIAGHSDPRMLLRIYNNLEVSHVANKLNNDSKSTKQNA